MQEPAQVADVIRISIMGEVRHEKVEGRKLKRTKD